MTAVTIIMPTYERARYLSEAIASALAQTYTDFVISVGDNSRDDEARHVVESFDDPRIRYRKHPRNLGQHANWLHLIDTAETPLVASLHDDDIWHPDLLEQLVPPLLDDPSISMSFGDFWVIDGDGVRDVALTEAASVRTHRSSMHGGKITGTLDDRVRLVAHWNAPQPALCAVIRRQAVLDSYFPESIAPLYDIWLSYEIACRGEAFFYVPQRLSEYRLHQTSSTAVGTWTSPEDDVFGRITTRHADLPCVGDIRRYWASLRWGRAMKYLAQPDGKARSRAELRAAAPDLTPATRRVVAYAAGYNGLVWEAIKRVHGRKPHREDRAA